MTRERRVTVRAIFLGILIVALAPMVVPTPPHRPLDAIVLLPQDRPPASAKDIFIAVSPIDETVIRDGGAYFRIRVVGADPTIRARRLDVQRARGESGTRRAPDALRSTLWPTERPAWPLPPRS